MTNSTAFADTVFIPAARPTTVVELGDGDRFTIRIAPVTRRLGGALVRMLAYNGSVPGPTIRVRQGSNVEVTVVNDGDMETTVHWHGLRLDNRSDGTIATQKPIPVGGAFTYRLSFPDPGAYWYHPHIREDHGQEMGLSGAIEVVPTDAAYWPPVNRALSVTLDDILLENGQVAPFDPSQPTHTAMGRFGNVLLINGELNLPLQVTQGEVVRLNVTNAANTRVFALAIPGAWMKLVGGDSGRYEREQFVEEMVIAPSERYVVDVLFERSGQYTLEHRTPQHTYVLGTITARPGAAEPSLVREFDSLRRNADFGVIRSRMEAWRQAEPDKTLSLVAKMDLDHLGSGGSGQYVCPMHPEVTSNAPGKCPECGMKLVPADIVPEAGHHTHESAIVNSLPPGIEWEDDMVEINRRTNPSNMQWKLIERETGAEGETIDWQFRVGDQVKIRLVNEMDSDHPMHHPFHIHGAGRFIILSRDGVVEPNLVWKDTVLIPTGQVVDILLDVTHPGVWMAHCHIAEHHESGMMLRFRVEAQALAS